MTYFIFVRFRTGLLIAHRLTIALSSDKNRPELKF